MWEIRGEGRVKARARSEVDRKTKLFVSVTLWVNGELLKTCLISIRPLSQNFVASETAAAKERGEMELENER